MWPAYFVMDHNTIAVMEMPMDKKTLTIPEAAKVLGVGRSAAYEAARTGQIPTIKIGKRILVPVTALERLLAGDDREAA